MRSWLKEKRLKNELTQEETARLSKISRSYYTHIEKGTKTPTVKIAKQIAHTLDFHWPLLFEDEETIDD